MIKHEFDLKEHKYTAETIKNKCVFHLVNIDSHDELITVLIHEAIHATFNILKVGTNAEQDHYIMKRMEIKWF